MWLAERISIVFESGSGSEWKGNNDLIQTARLLGSGSAGQYITVRVDLDYRFRPREKADYIV